MTSEHKRRHQITMPRIRTLSKSPKHRSITHHKLGKTNKWQKFYGNKLWHQLREQKLYEQPLCEECLMQGRITPATQVHHKDKFGDYYPDEQLMWEKFLDYDNLESICTECHRKIHNTSGS